MNDIERSRWPRRLFFVFIGLFFVASFYWISIRQVDLSMWRTRPVVSSEALEGEPAPRVLAPGEEIYCFLDQPAAVDGLRIIYRGKNRGVLHFDLVIPALDSEYAYSHLISEAEAEDGFRLYGRKFVLTYRHDTRIRLRWVE